MRRLVIVGGIFCAIVVAYAFVRYPLVFSGGVIWLHDRVSKTDCPITWFDGPVRPCNTRLALWLYHTGLWTVSEHTFMDFHIDYFPYPPVAGKLEHCVHFKIVHIGNRGTTLGLDNGSVLYIAPADREKPFLDPEANLERHNWHDGGEVLVCTYHNKYAPQYAVYKVDGEQAAPLREPTGHYL